MLSHLLLPYPEEGGGVEPKKPFPIPPPPPPPEEPRAPISEKMLHSPRYYYRHRQKVKGPAYQLINQSTINHVLPLQNYQYIRFFYHPWQLYLTLPRSCSFFSPPSPLTYTPLTPPPFQNLSEIAVLFPTRLGKLSWKIPTRVSLFSFFSRQLQNGAIILDNAIFLQKKQHYKKEKKKKRRDPMDWAGRRRQPVLFHRIYLTCPPYATTTTKVQ